MATIDYEAESRHCQAEVARHFRWNFGVNVLDGAFYWFGINFAAPSTIVALYARHLTQNAMLIGLIATIAGSGFSLPQLFTANYIRRMPVKKDAPVKIGLFSERLPFFVLAASAFLLPIRAPQTALIVLFLALTWNHFGAGLVAVGWQEMIAKVIPVQYRGRLLGIANFVGTATGVLGAAAAAGVLYRYPFPTGFAICFLIAGVFAMLSWISLALTREPPLHSQSPETSFRDFARRLPSVLRHDRNFALFIAARIANAFGRMGIGFLTVYAVERWFLSDAQAGLYTAAMLIGQAIANLILGTLADRRGHKLVLEISVALGVLAMISAVVAPSPSWMYAAFAAIGAVTASDILSGISIAMEFSSAEDRPTYIGMASTIPGLFSAIAPLIGGAIASLAGYQTTFLVSAVCGLASLIILRLLVREPRLVDVQATVGTASSN